MKNFNFKEHCYNIARIALKKLNNRCGYGNIVCIRFCFSDFIIKNTDITKFHNFMYSLAKFCSEQIGRPYEYATITKFPKEKPVAYKIYLHTKKGIVTSSDETTILNNLSLFNEDYWE